MIEPPDKRLLVGDVECRELAPDSYKTSNPVLLTGSTRLRSSTIGKTCELLKARARRGRPQARRPGSAPRGRNQLVIDHYARLWL